MLNNINPDIIASVIVPVRNGGNTLDACLHSIERSTYKNYEIIVVDDHSTDNSIEIAKKYDSTIVQLTEDFGANHARNLGAKNAKGRILVFIDSDIVIKRDTIQMIVESLNEGLDTVVGVYTAKHRNENLVSQYKNLWIRFSYMKSPPTIDWLFGAISGIKREIFEKIGGFNVELLAKHGNDDIELGKRFSKVNANIILDLDLEVEHLKNYTVRSFIKNEFNRSMGFAKLATELGETSRSLKQGFVNVYPVFVLSTLFVIVLAALATTSVMGLTSYWFLVGGLFLYILLNIRFLNYLEQVRGLFTMIAMIPILFIDHIVCFVGSIIGIIKGLFKK